MGGYITCHIMVELVYRYTIVMLGTSVSPVLSEMLGIWVRLTCAMACGVIGTLNDVAMCMYSIRQRHPKSVTIINR